MNDMNNNVQSRLLKEISNHPDGIGLMDLARPFLHERSETAIRHNIRNLVNKNQIRMERVLDRIMLYPVSGKE
jgi:hypothetical protein